MVLIQTNSQDYSSNDVVQWLLHNKIDFSRLNDEVCITSFNFSTENFSIETDSKKIDLNEVSFYWYRRGNFSITLDKNFKTEINQFLTGENNTVKTFLNYYFRNKLPSLNNFQTSANLNKIIACDIAEELGLRIPRYVITTKKKDLKKFKKKYSKIISKTLNGIPGFKLNDSFCSSKTSLITTEDISNAPNYFLPSLFQEYIEKEIEIRTFFLKNEFFSSAIFSQADERTKIDFRNYNREKPNRVIPFKLPTEVEGILLKINTRLKINSGSYDIIKTPNNEYVFLEVNPVGQFAQVSIPCNYYLEKEIAHHLSQYEKK